MTKVVLFVLTILLMVGCQDDKSIEEGSSSSGNKSIPSQVTVLSNDGSSVYQVDVETLQERVTEYNLTQLFGVETDYRSIQLNEAQISFVYNRYPSYSAIVKDASSQNHQSFQFNMSSNIFEDYEGPDFPMDSNEWFLLFTQIGQGEIKELAVHAIHHRTGEYKKIIFGNGLRTYWSVESLDNILLVDFQNEERRRIMARINLSSGEVSTKNFGKSYFAALNKNQLHLISCSPNTYERYDIQDWSLIESRQTNSCNELNWRLGLNNIQFNVSEILVDMPIAQPSPDLSSPGIFDYSSGTMIESNVIIPDVRYEIANKYNESAINIETYAVDLQSKIIVVGYEKSDLKVSGGLIFTNFSGEILKDIPLERVPMKIIITES